MFCEENKSYLRIFYYNKISWQIKMAHNSPVHTIPILKNALTGQLFSAYQEKGLRGKYTLGPFGSFINQ